MAINVPGRAGELSEVTVDCLHRGENVVLAESATRDWIGITLFAN